ncbi:APC family permease [Actinoallomurus bryophytorum]|uniref:Amino acid/polyamine/organocation transporter (APC superfamily) n=1 Tax=Actinoallomurus bryophytorum TaxID=1490222 RepID=A0A543CJF9_9ACTN|nr:APC family permease [Actinoallomurus bryophytorum]TQL97027.1 amino acid/polyamine/organocation transporter (APC superfamily) [Actinoallomurus bryophytorum]
MTSIWRFLIGPPLRAREVAKEQINPPEGLSALSLDALTSVAYGPEAILAVLVVAGAGALHLVLPVTVAIVVLLGLLVFSYRQVIDAYPGGGGAYAVSRANLGPAASRVAGASLIVDYTLTVAVSIAAGVGALTSAFPALGSFTVPICLGILAVITLLNLRGLGEAARAFLLPTMVFIAGLLAILAIGLLHPLAPGLARRGPPPHGTLTVGALLVLKAFSAGCSALTGVEAIANGVPLFRPPRTVQAKRTEMLLGVILGVMLLGLAVLADRWRIAPRSHQTVLSQVMAAAIGQNWAFYAMSITITLVLALAANTSFGGMPVLASLLARDSYLPRLFSLRDDRQVFASGIVTLAIMAAALLVAVQGNTLSLIPLYAIGVFTGFTLSQAGMVVHWWRTRPTRWRHRAIINGVGACATAVATIIFLITKFTAGAWIVVLAIPSLITLFVRIHRYYQRAGRALGLGAVPGRPQSRPTVVVVPVTGISRLTEHAIAQALSISPQVIAVTVVINDPRRAHELQDEWRHWNPGAPLRVLQTEFASAARPIVKFVNELYDSRDEQIIVLIPVLRPEKLRYSALHNHLDLVITTELRNHPNIILARVPMPLTLHG